MTEPTTSAQTRPLTVEEQLKKLFERTAKLNDALSALIAPDWGAQAGLLPETHPLHPSQQATPLELVRDEETPDAVNELAAAVRDLASVVRLELDERGEFERTRVAEAERDGAYRERAHLVALLAALTGGAVITYATDVDEPGWQIGYLSLGGRQASWHISPRDADLFAHVERVEHDDPRAHWDGHTTEEKYLGIAAWTIELAQRHAPNRPDTSDGGAAEAVRQMDADPTQPHTGLVVQPYRDCGQQLWVFRCWGTDTCDGYLSLDHTSQQGAEQARDRHVTEEHTTTEETPMPNNPCTATIDGPHVPGDDAIQCTREALHLGSHVGPNPDGDGKTLWTDHHAGAAPHRRAEDES